MKYSITEPVVIAHHPPGGDKTIMYMHSMAITQCDCGKELILTEVFYGRPYTGACACGLKWTLFKGKIKSE